MMKAKTILMILIALPLIGYYMLSEIFSLWLPLLFRGKLGATGYCERRKNGEDKKA